MAWPGQLKKRIMVPGFSDRRAIIALMSVVLVVPCALPSDSKTWQVERRAGAVIMDRLDKIDMDTDCNRNKDFKSLVGNDAREAEIHLRLALPQAQDAHADEAVIADILFQLSRSLCFQEKYQEARKPIFSAKAIREKLYGARSLPVLGGYTRDPAEAVDSLKNCRKSERRLDCPAGALE